ncbi:MAG: VWA domain-containing protein, partial [Kribbellaceae bacterium]
RHGSATRGAVVLIASDGWDSEDPAALAAAMARLRRRAFRVIWMNPRAAAAGFAPLTGAMAAALPYCDELLPGDTLRAVGRVLEVSSRA